MTNPFGIEAGSNKFLYKTKRVPNDTYYIEVKPFKESSWVPLLRQKTVVEFNTFIEAVGYINRATRTPAYYRIVNTRTNQVEETFAPRETF